jgi:hypothetical protein
VRKLAMVLVLATVDAAIIYQKGKKGEGDSLVALAHISRCSGKQDVEVLQRPGQLRLVRQVKPDFHEFRFGGCLVTDKVSASHAIKIDMLPMSRVWAERG